MKICPSSTYGRSRYDNRPKTDVAPWIMLHTKTEQSCLHLRAQGMTDLINGVLIYQLAGEDFPRAWLG